MTLCLSPSPEQRDGEWTIPHKCGVETERRGETSTWKRGWVKEGL